MYEGQSIFKIVRKETMMITMPTASIMVLTGSFLDKLAAMGAAIIPPKTKPNITWKWFNPRKMIKVTELENATKNSARLTDPMV